LSEALAGVGVFVGQLTRVEGTLERLFLGLTQDGRGPVASTNGHTGMNGHVD